MTVDRREFTRASILTAVAAVAGSGAPRRDPPATAPAAAAPAAPGAQQSQEPSAEARALGEWVRARYGERLSDAEVADIVRDIDAGLRRAARLNAPALANADEPDFVFRPYRGGD